MNIMIITERSHQANPLNGLMSGQSPNGQNFICIGFEGKAESALTPLFNLNLQGDPKRHAVIIADDISHLWQGSRQLLDVVIETSNPEAEQWLANLLRGKGDSKTQFQVTAWEYLQRLAKSEKGKEIYDAIRNNIQLEQLIPYSGQKWWRADWPLDNWYWYLMLSIDQGSGTLLYPPGAVKNTFSEGTSKGRQAVYFGWMIKPDGTVYPLNPYAQWLEGQLSGLSTPPL